MGRPKSTHEPQDRNTIEVYLERQKGRLNTLDYVMVVRRHPLMKIPSWMSSYDAMGIDLDGRLVFDPYRYDTIQPKDRTDKMYLCAVDPLNDAIDIRLYWNPDTQVWIGLRPGICRIADMWPHRSREQRARVIAAARKTLDPKAAARVSETLAIRRAARAARMAAAMS